MLCFVFGDLHYSKDTKYYCYIRYISDTEVSEKNHKGIRASPPKQVAELIAQLKCNYTNAHSVGNNQELEVIVQQENYNIADITETG